MKIVLTLFCTLILTSTVISQNLILKTSESLKRLDQVYYSVIVNNMMLENTYIDTLNVSIKTDPTIKPFGAYFTLVNKHISTYFDGESLIVLNSRDSTFNREKASESQFTRSLISHWIKQLDRFVRFPERMIPLSDSVILDKPVYAFRYLQKRDSVVNNHRLYNYHTFYVTKDTFQPVFIESDMSFMYNDLPSRLKTSYLFSDFITSEFVSQPIPTYYQDFKTKPVKEEIIIEPLEIGSVAPDFKVLDYKNNDISLKDYTGHVILLNFTSVECPHAYNAMGALKKIEERFANRKVQIINIYENQLTSNEKIANLSEKFGLEKMRSAIDTEGIANSYHSDGFPNFYIIDKTGNIGFYKGGYSAKTEAELTTRIEELLRTK